MSAHPLGWALIFGALLLLGVLLTLTPRFESNDDAIMQAIVDGTFLGKPSPHLIYGNVLVGLLLQALYQAVSWIPWYGCYLYAAHFASVVAFIYVVLAGRRHRSVPRILVLLAVLALFQLPMWLTLQFTSTALLLGASGVMLYTSLVYRERTPWTGIVVAGALVGLSSWVRWEAIKALALLAIPVIALGLRRVAWRKLALFLGTAATIVVLGAASQAIYYAGKPDWQAYFSYNSVRQQLHQTHLEVDSAVLADVGWNTNDLRMFRNWFFSDPSVYQRAHLETVLDSLPHSLRLGAATSALGTQAEGWLGATRLALTLGLACLVWAEADRRLRIWAVVAALTCGGTAFGLAATAKLPSRVALPILAFLVMFYVTGLCVGSGERSERHRGGAYAWWWVAAAISVAAIAVGAVTAANVSRANDDSLARSRRLFAAFEEFDPRGVFVTWGAQVPYWDDPLSPWTRSRSDGPERIGLGWLTQSPIQRALMEEHGIDDIYLAIAGRQDVYLPLRGRGLASAYLTYLRDHHGLSGMLKPVARIDSYVIYNTVVTYRLDRQAHAIVEEGTNGTTLAYPIRARAAHAAVTQPGRAPGRVLITGRSTADLILIMRRGQPVSLVLPADDHNGRGTFRIEVTGTTHNLRLFALSGGYAVKIPLEPADA